MRVAVLGAGAIGCLVGGLLAAASHDVALIGRPGRLAAVVEGGLRVRLPGGQRLASCPAVFASPAAAAAEWGTPDVVALTVKAFDVPEAARALQAAWPAVPAVVAFQNGIGTEEHLTRLFGPERVVAATVTLSAGLQDGEVVVFNRAGGLALAPVPGGEAACRRLATAWTGLPVPLALAPDAASLKWSKVLLNLVGNAVGAILQWDVGRIFRHPFTARLEHRSLREAVMVARAAAPVLVDLPGYPVRAFARLVEWLPAPLFARLVGPRAAGGRGGKLPSVALDLAAGRQRTETPYLHGAVAREAVARGLEAPVNGALARLVEELAADPAQRERYRDRPDELGRVLAAGGLRL
ncbi:MAG TPA: 2-dehydropantoate 2-reductase [Thermaerobacter sp.]